MRSGRARMKLLYPWLQVTRIDVVITQQALHLYLTLLPVGEGKSETRIVCPSLMSRPILDHEFFILAGLGSRYGCRDIEFVG